MFDSKTAAQWGRVGGTVRNARHDPVAFAKQGQSALLARFARDIDPDGLLPEDERLRRAIRMRKAHMLRLNLMRTAKRRTAQLAEAPSE